MLKFDLAQLDRIQAAHNLEAAPSAFFRDGGKQHRRENISLTADSDLRVAERGIVSNGEIGRQRPGCRRPDQDVGVRRADHWKFYEDTLADMVVVFDFGFGQRRATRNTPVNGFLAAINKASLDNVGEQTQFVCFVFFVQREVGIVPIAEDTQAFELFALEVDVFAGISLAGFADRDSVESGRLFRQQDIGRAPGTCFRHLAGRADFTWRASAGWISLFGLLDDGSTLLAHLLRDLEFDRQAVAVPAGDIRRAVAAQSFVFDDEIFEDLVRGVADVDIAVGKGRAVVQDKSFGASPRNLNLFVELVRLPFFEAVRFA